MIFSNTRIFINILHKITTTVIHRYQLLTVKFKNCQHMFKTLINILNINK